MQILCKTFEELTTMHLYHLLRLRSEAFVVEQKCIYQDIDNKDIEQGVLHLLLYKNNALVAYARLLPQGVSYATPSIGRIVTSHAERGAGMGNKLVALAINKCRQQWPNCAITIGAQCYLLGFYHAFGFKEISEQYLEDGIAHIDMRLNA